MKTNFTHRFAILLLLSLLTSVVQARDLLKGVTFKPLKKNLNQEKWIDPTTGIMASLETSELGKGKLQADANGIKVVIGGIPGQFLSSNFTAELSGVPSIPKGQHYRVRYKASGLARPRVKTPLLLLDNESLLLLGEANNDQGVHTVIGTLREAHDKPAKLELRLQSDGIPACFELMEITLLSKEEAFPQGQGSAESIQRQGSRTVAMEPLLKSDYFAEAVRTLKAHGKVIDYMPLPATSSLIEVSATPFQLASAPHNLALPVYQPPKPRPKRRGGDMFPEAAEGIISVPISGQAAEICFLMTAALPTVMNGGAAPMIPMRLRSTAVLIIQVCYADGTSDWAYPYSLADGHFVVQRFCGAYAVPADPTKELKEFRLYNRYRNRQGMFGLLAVTLNESVRHLNREVLAPKLYTVTKNAREDVFKPQASFRENDGILSLQNRDYSMTFSTKNGFGIETLKIPWLDKDAAELAGGLEVDYDGKIYHGKDFDCKKVTLEGQKANILLVARPGELPISFQMVLDASAPDRITWHGTVVNNSNASLAATIHFPAINAMHVGDGAANWLYFPKYNSVLSRQDEILSAPAGERAFHVQFFDIFNPCLNTGVMFLTHNLEAKVLDYCLMKTRGRVRAFIRHPKSNYLLPSGGTQELVSTSLVFHRGDWHKALSLYKQWVGTWFKPRKSDLKWWNELFFIRSEWNIPYFGWIDPAYDAQKGEFRYDELMNESVKRMQQKPDMFHIRGYNIPPPYPGEIKRTGEPARGVNDGIYDPRNFIGREGQFIEAIKGIQSNGIKASLYTIPQYLPKLSPLGRSIGREVTLIESNGSPLEDGNCWFPCIHAWSETYASALQRLMENTGIDAIYIDTFPLPRFHNCHNRAHGHPIPMQTGTECNRFLQNLRAKIGPDKAIWTEDPVMDVDIQYANGSITYYSVPTNEHRARPFGDDGPLSPALIPPQSIIRYAFPDYKTFSLFSGHDSGTPAATFFSMFFFNGEGYLDVTYAIFDSLTLPVLRRQMKLLTDYKDCFATRDPVPWVDTEMPYIFANRFPGKGRTIWTLFNGYFTQYRGKAISVPHQDGMAYKDLWNDVELTPEIKDGTALIQCDLMPQGIGCILQYRKNDK